MKKLALMFALVCTQTNAATVIGISDGDTLTVMSNGHPLKVRLANIDAPEKRQPFGISTRRRRSSRSERVPSNRFPTCVSAARRRLIRTRRTATAAPWRWSTAAA
jgi:endonuclease YncB( thermonuclease family)